MKLKTAAVGTAVLIGAAALSVPTWTSETGKGTAKPTSTAVRKSVVFTVTFTPGPEADGPSVLQANWTVGTATGSPKIFRSGAVIDTGRGRRGEVVNLTVAATRDYKGSEPVAITCVAMYDGLEIGSDTSSGPRGCSVTGHVPAV